MCNKNNNKKLKEKNTLHSEESIKYLQKLIYIFKYYKLTEIEEVQGCT